MTGRRWRDTEPETFAATILTAADSLGVQPLAVEKDYWVCEALRGIVEKHPGEVVFKGGTSLEKLRLIQRFSEDLDLLVIGAYDSARSQKRALKAHLDTAADALGAQPEEVVSGGNPGTFWRRGYLAPPLEHITTVGGMADPAAILVELGQTGGPNPHEPREITSLLGRALDDAGFPVAGWDDLSPFDVDILHPGRTLLEKLLRVNNFVITPENIQGEHGWPRVGRQYYDIYALLGDAEVLDLLANQELASEIVRSAQEVSAKIGRPDAAIPAGGFAASAAFDPESRFASRLRIEHESAMKGLYYGTTTPPSFDDVLERVHQNAANLTLAI